MNSLGLAGVFEYKNQIPEIVNGLQTGVTAYFRMQLTEFGKLLAGVCEIDDERMNTFI